MSVQIMSRRSQLLAASALGFSLLGTTAQAEEVHADLRRQLKERYNAQIADQVRILYGGSVKPDNAADLLAQPNVDGALIGGASLKAADFLAIASAGAAVALLVGSRILIWYIGLII